VLKEHGAKKEKRIGTCHHSCAQAVTILMTGAMLLLTSGWAFLATLAKQLSLELPKATLSH
jgi:hypothetical protein